MAKKKVVEPVENDVVTTPEVVEPDKSDVAETPDLVTGKVTNCIKLNVRKKPDSKAAVIAILDCSEKVTVDTKKSTDAWYKVSFGTAKEGYCMKEYIKVD